jgi:hypothetical protein
MNKLPVKVSPSRAAERATNAPSTTKRGESCMREGRKTKQITPLRYLLVGKSKNGKTFRFRKKSTLNGDCPKTV